MERFDSTDMEIKRLFDSVKTETDDAEFIRKTKRLLSHKQGRSRLETVVYSVMVICVLAVLLNLLHGATRFDADIYAAAIKKGDAVVSLFMTLVNDPLRIIAATLAVISLTAYALYQYIQRI